MKHSTFTLLISLYCCLFTGMTCFAQEEEITWRVGGQLGIFGVTFDKQIEPGKFFTQNFTISLDEAKINSPWRWGMEAGLTGDGREVYIEDEGSEVFLHPSFVYAGAFADYTFGSHPIFIRAGLAYSCQTDIWTHHYEIKHIPLVITGIGLDVRGRVMFMLNGYIAPGGIFVLTVSGGIYKIHKD